MSRVRGVCDDGTCLFFHSGVVPSPEGWAGTPTTLIISAVLTVRCSLLISDLLADPNQTVIDKHRTYSITAE